MNTSEPTTSEIVRALRYCVGKDTICGTACPAYLSEAGCRTTIMKNAADRLESQGREIERLIEELEQMEEAATVLHAANETRWTYIKELTARAEQAERERDAMVKSVDRLTEAWENFKSPALIEFIKQWRGQPQEGEEK